VKALKDASSYISTAWQNQASRRVGPTQNNGTAATRLADARMTVLEEENAALRQELSRRTACAHECRRCGGSDFESGRPPREGKSESARLAALERRIEEIRSSIIKAIEERFGGCQLNDPEKRGRDCRSTLPQVAPSTLPRNHQRHPRGNRRRMNGKWWLPKGRE
jgi:hypothetical protein